jgi:hypothetical protein
MEVCLGVFYDFAITVPKSTTEANAVTTIAKVTHGVITRVSFRPRPGHSALLHCQVSYHEHQLWPVSREEDLHGDTFPIEWDDYEELFTDPYELKIVAWNEDDTYAHTFDLGFALLPENIVAPVNWGKVMTDIFSLLSPRRLFGGGG